MCKDADRKLGDFTENNDVRYKHIQRDRDMNVSVYVMLSEGFNYV